MEFLSEVLNQLRPHAVTAAVGIGLSLIALVSAVLANAAKKALDAIKDEKLALSLYRTIENVLKSIVARKVADGSMTATGTLPSAIINEALKGVKEANPKSVLGMDQTDGALIEKIVARYPEAKAAVVNATEGK